MGVELSVVSNRSEDDFTSDWVGITGITGGGENNHLSSLRNAWGKCRGITGGVFNPSAKGSSGMSSEGSTGRKGSLSFRMFIPSREQSMLKIFQWCQILPLGSL